MFLSHLVSNLDGTTNIGFYYYKSSTEWVSLLLSQEILDYSHIPGQAVLHCGRHRHGAHPTTSGNRINLLLWCRRYIDSLVYMCMVLLNSCCFSLCNLDQNVVMNENYFWLRLIISFHGQFHQDGHEFWTTHTIETWWISCMF